jgi:hypothetical protein
VKEESLFGRRVKRMMEEINLHLSSINLHPYKNNS